ncbi:transcription factor Zelda-like [Onthophagus taurus]|uniref:transcription factor Zelda-like n=1 Tax=Onthophagus taurus TaxID=166361 RepID=UPI0039BDC36F
MKNTDYENEAITNQSGYSDSSTYLNQQNTMDYQLNRVKTEPQPPEEYSQQFYTERYQSENNFNPYNQENVSKINSYRYHPYERPNSEQPQNNGAYLPNSPNSKQCEKCGFICNSMDQITEHVNNCQQSTTPLGNVTNYHNYNMLSGGEIIKTETEILDLDSYKVHQVLPEEENIRQQPQQLQPNQLMNQWNQPNENQNPPMFSPNEQRWEPDGNPINNQRIFSPNYRNYPEETPQNFPSQGFSIETTTSTATPVVNQPPSSAKNNWKSNDSRKPKNYNCTSCKKWFTSSGHLKRHYNTTLHKNAVKTSGLPDPANLPISVHHHPKATQNRADTQIPLHSPEEDVERIESPPSEQYELPSLVPLQTMNQQNYDDPPNVQADPSVMESRGLLSITNQMHIQPTHNTFNTINNTINNGFQHHMLPPMNSPYYPMHPDENIPNNSMVLVVNDLTTITEETDNSQPLPSFSQIQRYNQVPYYGDMSQDQNYQSYDLSSYNQQQPPCYQPIKPEEIEETRRYTMIAPPDSTSTDGDIVPISSSSNNNNLIVNNTPIDSELKYNVYCSSPETSNDIPDVENSNPQISSTSNIVKPQPLHKCFDCDKVFNKSCYLTQHNKTFHCGDKPYKCVRCGKRFSCEQQHLEHKAKHGGEKPHKCEQCPKQFNHKTDLRRHMCLHTGKKPFSCGLCGKGFIRKDHMIKHGDTHLKIQKHLKPKNYVKNQ